MGDVQKIVYVGLSGGVDSSVAAALLQQQGFYVVGVYMKNWTQAIAGNLCPWEDDLRSAKSVAVHLGIELKVFDLQVEYKQLVVDAMVQAYAAGLTPNPDILCNEEIKFALFYRLCRQAGADFIATGHYANLSDGRLGRAKDKKKDQTYFLYRMPVEAAAQVIFPLGGFTKVQVRLMAAKYHLPTAKRRESMGLCFVGKIPLKDFLGEFMELTPGLIVDEQGQELGQHYGAALYTIGQRHGLGVGGGTPYYVLAKDLATNRVIVTVKPAQLKRDYYDIADIIWWQTPELGKKYSVRIRHLGELLDCLLDQRLDGVWRINLLNGAHRGVAAGQHAVLYDGELVLGGGVIQ